LARVLVLSYNKSGTAGDTIPLSTAEKLLEGNSLPGDRGKNIGVIQAPLLILVCFPKGYL
jgi:hypothetical protein